MGKPYGRIAGVCGRFVIAGNKAAIRDSFSVDETFQDEFKPSQEAPRIRGWVQVKP